MNHGCVTTLWIPLTKDHSRIYPASNSQYYLSMHISQQKGNKESALLHHHLSRCLSVTPRPSSHAHYYVLADLQIPGKMLKGRRLGCHYDRHGKCIRDIKQKKGRKWLLRMSLLPRLVEMEGGMSSLNALTLSRRKIIFSLYWRQRRKRKRIPRAEDILALSHVKMFTGLTCLNVESVRLEGRVIAFL